MELEDSGKGFFHGETILMEDWDRWIRCVYEGMIFDAECLSRYHRTKNTFLGIKHVESEPYPVRFPLMGLFNLPEVTADTNIGQNRIESKGCF